MHPSSLRRQLLGRYLLTVALLVAAGELALFAVLWSAGERELDAGLRKIIERLDAGVELETYRPHLNGKRALAAAPLDSSRDAWQVLLPDGSTLARGGGPAAGTSDLPAVGGLNLSFDEVAIEDVVAADGRVLRAGRIRVDRVRLEKGRLRPEFDQVEVMPDRMVFDLRAVTDRTPLDRQTRRLGGYLLAGYPLILAVAGVVGLRLIHSAVAPVEAAFDRERGFAGTVSHELRTPLAALRAEVDVCLRRPRSADDYREAIGRIGRTTDRMMRLVEVLLAHARYRDLAAGSEAEFTIEQLWSAIRTAAVGLPGSERVQYVPPVVGSSTVTCCDEIQLALATRNLIENALGYGNDSIVQVELVCEAASCVVIRVTDQGDGFPDDLLALVSGPSYHQLPLSRRHGGFGLGLSIAASIVESHNGRMSIRSDRGVGSVVELTIPLSDRKAKMSSRSLITASLNV